jgi:hypothetical protein
LWPEATNTKKLPRITVGAKTTIVVVLLLLWFLLWLLLGVAFGRTQQQPKKKNNKKPTVAEGHKSATPTLLAPTVLCFIFGLSQNVVV